MEHDLQMAGIVCGAVVVLVGIAAFAVCQLVFGMHEHGQQMEQLRIKALEAEARLLRLQAKLPEADDEDE